MPLACPSCRAGLTLGEVLDTAFSSVPDEGLIDFRCPACGERGLARLADGLAETVRPMARGAQKVVSFSFEVAPDLAITPRPLSLRVWYGGRQQDVPDRRMRIVPPGAPPGRPAA
jgi:hypothetical protein